VRGVQLIDISLRGLHVKRTPPLLRPFIAAFQRLLRETSIGKAFFGNVATPRVRGCTAPGCTAPGCTAPAPRPVLASLPPAPTCCCPPPPTCRR
jgi:hypothetical protein